MTLNCPHCGQPIEFDETAAGANLECPNCHQNFLVPRTQPAGDGSKATPPRKRLGCELYFWLLLALATGGFGYAMRQWHTNPQQTLQRMVATAQSYVLTQPTPAPVEEETEEAAPAPKPAATATPKPDPLPWLVAHKGSWPNQVVLQEPMEFPAVSNGKSVGSLIVPAGSALKVLEITKDDVSADFMGGNRRVPVNATDLRGRAEVAMRKFELEGEKAPAAAAATTKEIEEPEENIREATRDEISRGLGAMYTRQETIFRVFAPSSKTVSVLLYDSFSGNEGRLVQPLRQQPNGIWDATVSGDLRGKFYTYLLDAADPKHAREVLDPYATNAVASSTRGRITPMTAPPAPGPKLESPVDAIVYEMHVRDFTIAPNSGVKDPGLYLGFTESGTHLADDPSIKTALDHLVELGITHVELMPVQDFQNDEESRGYNWGYITSDFFSPEGMFATGVNNGSRVRELKALVKALHERGLSVNMDVVYNHTADKASMLSIAPDYYYRRGANGGMANGSGCGNEVKSESPMARRLIIDSLKYWASEFGFDGFRFDLMALIDQDTMRQADRELRAINPGIILFGEPWTGGTSPLTTKCDKDAIRKVPAGAFNDDFRNALKGEPEGNSPGWIQNGSKKDALKAAMLVSNWLASPAQSINYMTCHDNLVLWDKLLVSMPNATDALRIETMKLGYLALFTSQGVPFIHGGEEFARSKGGNNNSYEAPDSVNQVDWSLKRDHLDLFNYVRDAIALRKAHPLFRLRTRAEVGSRLQFVSTPDQRLLMYTINGDGVRGEQWRRACVVLNSADDADIDVNLPPGNWNVAMDATGAVAAAQTISGKLTVRHKSGVVLFQ